MGRSSGKAAILAAGRHVVGLGSDNRRQGAPGRPQAHCPPPRGKPGAQRRLGVGVTCQVFWITILGKMAVVSFCSSDTRTATRRAMSR